jgi:hypothetical protein
MLHDVPFHVSASVSRAKGDADPMLYPTAVQALDEVQATSMRTSLAAPGGTGATAWAVHALPFQAAAYGPRLEAPTASQASAEAHDTLLSTVWVAPDGAGTGCAVQVVPFQPAAKALKLVPRPPTASQALAETQDTPR